MSNVLKVNKGAKVKQYTGASIKRINLLDDNSIVTNMIQNQAVTSQKISTGVITKTTSSVLGGTEDIVLVDCTSGAVTLTLPTAVGISGKTLTIKKIDSSLNLVTVVGSIDQYASYIFGCQNDYISIVSDDTKWNVFSDNVTVAASYNCSLTTSCAGGADTLIDFNTKIYDTINSVSGSGASWKFTAKYAGKYSISSLLQFSSMAWTSTHMISLMLYKGGVQLNGLGSYRWNAAVTTVGNIQGSTEIDLLADEYIDIRVYVTATNTLNGSTNYNRLTITRVGN